MVEIIKVYSRTFYYEGQEGWGFSFDCDKDGNVDVKSLNPAARENYESCLRGEVRGRKVVDKGVSSYEQKFHVCDCGSGEPQEALYDARGIFASYYCTVCEQEVRSRFRPEVLEDPNYYAEEDIEPEY